MNSQGFIILFIPLIGLVTICKNKKWNWNVIKDSRLLTSIFWLGWFSSLIVGIITIINDTSI